MGEAGKEAKSILQKLFSDLSKKSASKQIVLGASSGWLTGFLVSKSGKATAIAVGSGIVTIQIANQMGYININWDKICSKKDKVVEKVTGKETSTADKVSNFVDKKLSKAEENLKKQQGKVKSWWNDDNTWKVKEIHVFLVAFAAGVAVGVATS